MLANTGSQSIEVITALEHRYQTTPGILIGYFQQAFCHPPVAAGGKINCAKWVSLVGVKTRRNQHHFWSKLMNSGQNLLFERPLVFTVAASSGHRTVEGRAGPAPKACLRCCTGAWIMRVLMEANVVHRGIIFKCVLSAIPMIS